jgi:glycosyltransferase involved in cell wall biosynthesis
MQIPLAEAKVRLGIPADAVVIGCVGALCEQKGQRYLIQALPLIREKVPKAQVLLVGTGPESDMLRTLARECGCEASVSFVGEHDDVVSFLSAMDIFAFPSIAEGLGLALIEAMGCGVPVVASSVGGVPEVVTDGWDGLLVDPRSPIALANAIIRMNTDHQLAESMGKHAIATVAARFQTKIMLKEVSDLYCRVLQSPRLSAL